MSAVRYGWQLTGNARLTASQCRRTAWSAAGLATRADVVLVAYWELLQLLPFALDIPVILDFVAPRPLEVLFEAPEQTARHLRNLAPGAWPMPTCYWWVTLSRKQLLSYWLLEAGMDLRAGSRCTGGAAGRRTRCRAARKCQRPDLNRVTHWWRAVWTGHGGSRNTTSKPCRRRSRPISSSFTWCSLAAAIACMPALTKARGMSLPALGAGDLAAYQDYSAFCRPARISAWNWQRTTLSDATANRSVRWTSCATGCRCCALAAAPRTADSAIPGRLGG